MRVPIPSHNSLPSSSAQAEKENRGSRRSNARAANIPGSYSRRRRHKKQTKVGVFERSFFGNALNVNLPGSSKQNLWRNKRTGVNPNKLRRFSPFVGGDICYQCPYVYYDSLQRNPPFTIPPRGRNGWQDAVDDVEREKIIREKIGLLTNERYHITQRINFGAYGSIYSAYDICTRKNVAVKFESDTRASSGAHLLNELAIYERLQGEVGVPLTYWYGEEFGHQILIMQLLGPSVEQLFCYCERSFDMNTIALLADQMFLRIRSLHLRGLIHGDIKPNNFLMGIGPCQHICFLVDFGLTKAFRIRDGNKWRHISFKKGNGLIGTAKYASVNSHNGWELSRRDDLESLGYVIIELINQELPWKKKARFKSKQYDFNRIRAMKKQTDWRIVCPAMAEWIYYCRRLRFDEEPDYIYLRRLIHSLFPKNNGTNVVRRGIGNGRKPLYEVNINSRNRSYYSRNRIVDDGTGRFSWLMRKDSSPDERYAYDTLFPWTLPSGYEVVLPPDADETSFRYGGYLKIC